MFSFVMAKSATSSMCYSSLNQNQAMRQKTNRTPTSVYSNSSQKQSFHVNELLQLPSILGHRFRINRRVDRLLHYRHQTSIYNASKLVNHSNMIRSILQEQQAKNKSSGNRSNSNAMISQHDDEDPLITLERKVKEPSSSSSCSPSSSVSISSAPITRAGATLRPVRNS